MSCGSNCARCRNVCSIRLASGRASGSPNPPASSAGVSPRGNSRRASGLPRVSAMIRSRTRLVQPPEDGSGQQRASVGVGKPCHMELRQADERVRVRGFADGEHHRNPLGQQTPGDEREHQRGRCDRATAHRRSSRPADAFRPPRPAGSGRPGPPGSDPGERPPAGRTPPAAPPAGAQAAHPGRRAAARRGDAVRRTRAPSRTARPQPARGDTRTPARRRIPGAPSCRCPPRRAAPAPSSRRPGCAAAAGRAPRTRCGGLAALAGARRAGRTRARPQLFAGADAELGEDLVQVVLDGARADEQLRADLRVRLPVGGELGDLRLLGREDVARVRSVPGARSRRWPRARGGRARRTPRRRRG